MPGLDNYRSLNYHFYFTPPMGSRRIGGLSSDSIQDILNYAVIAQFILFLICYWSLIVGNPSHSPGREIIDYDGFMFYSIFS
jgi:hypothetical protein